MKFSSFFFVKYDIFRSHLISYLTPLEREIVCVFVAKFRNKAFPQLSGRYDIEGGALRQRVQIHTELSQSTLHQVNCNGSPRFGYLAGRWGPRGALYTHSFNPHTLLFVDNTNVSTR